MKSFPMDSHRVHFLVGVSLEAMFLLLAFAAERRCHDICHRSDDVMHRVLGGKRIKLG